jgi:transposase
LNKYHLKTEKAIEDTCASILSKYETEQFFEYTITNAPLIEYKNKKKGRPSKGEKPEKVEVVKNRFSVKLHFQEAPFQYALSRCGYYPLITNKPKEDLSIEAAMMAHKNQYKPEHINRRAKSGYKGLESIYLHTPERIQAFLLLFKIVLQLVVLMERTVRNNIQTRDKGLDNFMPNRKDVRNPRTEYLLKEFEYVVSGRILLHDGKSAGFVSELNNLQKDILLLMEVPIKYFSYEYLFDTS